MSGRSTAVTGYAELQVTSHFSFLRGASSCEELFATAAALGIPALGIVDRGSLAGIVRAHEASRQTGVRLVVGSRVDLTDGTVLLLYPMDRAGYARLCRLLTIGKARAGKGGCELGWEDLSARSEGLLAILVPDRADRRCAEQMERMAALCPGRCYLALTLRRRPGDALRLHRLAEMATARGVPTVATGDVLYHTPDRRILQDVVTCIRLGCTIDDAGFKRERHADRHLKSPDEMARLFGRHPEAVARSLEVIDRCRFSLSEIQYQYPEEIVIPGLTAQESLERLTWQAVPDRYPDGPPAKVVASLKHELTLIGKLGYAPYFLTVHSIVRFARSQGILCQGRGSAANSAVCYVLGITSIDPSRHDLLFERFVSAERAEPPDIDVDFEHERRELVIQWIYETYGRHRAALTAVVSRYRSRGAIRDVGKVLGLTEDVTSALAGQVWAWSDGGVEDRHAEEIGLNLADRRLRLALDLARQLIGTPRHLSQHPGGFVLARDRLDELVPIEPAAMADRQVIEWDKDDIDVLRMMKVDILGLGMLGCMRRAFELLQDHRGVRMDLASIPAEDVKTYRMIQRADTLGTFQIESRAQMAMLPRMKPTKFYDLVIQVAIVRPGPIQGDMVHPYLRRREGKEAVEFPKPELEEVLGRTLGVPLFQEQAMRVAIVCAGFSAGEADMLRKSMATFKFTGGVSKFKDKLIGGMLERGYTQEFAEKTFRQLEGFGSYGFPESHAASFALIAYASSWVKCHHPEVFACALINSQPMGFYAPAQIVRDAREHNVEVRPVDVNRSRWDCTLERAGDGKLALRLGLRLVKGLHNAAGAALVAARGDRPYTGVEDMWRRAGVPVAALEHLAAADAFAGLGLQRRAAVWAIRAVRDEALPLFEAAGAGREADEPVVTLRPMSEGSEVVEDYITTSLSLRRHPVAFLRQDLRAMGIVPCADLARTRDGRKVRVAGLVLVRQKPGSANGVLFVTIEDESGVANLVVWQTLFEKQRRVILGSSMLGVVGRVQVEGEVIHVIADELIDLSDLLRSVGERGEPVPLQPCRGDEARTGGGPGMVPKVKEMYDPDLRPGSGIRPQARDFR